MWIKRFLALPGLLLVAANTLAAIATATAPGGAPPADSAAAAAVPDEVAYKAFLTVLSSVAEQDHHAYLHILGDALRVNVDAADEAGLQVVDSYGIALLDQQAALEAEESGIRRHLLCEAGVRPQSASEFLYSMGKIDREIDAARKTHLLASLSEMPEETRAGFQRFLATFSQGVSHSRLNVHAQLEAMGSIDAYIATVCTPDNTEDRNRLPIGGTQ